MKWIGQHIWDFISRFRSDVYLESINSEKIVTNIGLDINNKIVKSSIKYIDIPSSTHYTFEGDVILTTAASSTTTGNLVYMRTDGAWADADADDAVKSTTLLGIALGTDPTSDGVLIRGTFTLDHDVGNNQGVPLYVSTTAGDITATAPSSSGDIVRVVGYNLGNDDEIWFNPSGSWVEIA